MQTQPQAKPNDGWRRTTLSVPGSIVVEDVSKEDGPVAPPRKKRLSLIHPEQQLCGFKELFGNNTSRRSSCDSVLNDRSIDNDHSQQKRASDANATLNVVTETEVKVPLPLPDSESSAAAIAAVAAANLPPKKHEHRLQRNISKVGNKKSDKFFGENLSSCLSDEPVAPSPSDELDHILDAIISEQTKINAKANAAKKDGSAIMDAGDDEDEENKTSLDRKAEFLMAMLDDKNLYKDAANDEQVIVAPKRRHSKSVSPEKNNNEPDVVVAAKNVVNVEGGVKQEKQVKRDIADDADYYKDMTPVDEPIIVPTRRKSKPHICDDDDHLHDHIHVKKTEKIEQPKVDNERQVSLADLVEQIITPKKPKRIIRDESTPTQSPSQVETVVEKSRTETVQQKPVPKVRHLSQGNLMSPTRPTNTIDLSITSTAVDLVKQKNVPDSPNQSDSALRKCISQPSFFTQEVMNQIVDRVYGFKDPVNYIDSYDDGSSKVSPHSKLTTRKISVARKDSPAPIHENPSEEKSNEAVRMETVSAGPVSVIHTIETTTRSPIISSTQSIEDFLHLERMNSDIPLDTSPLRPGTPVNSIDSIEAAIEATTKSPRTETVITETVVGAISSPPTNNVLDAIYSSNRSILDEFQKYLDAETKTPSMATSECSVISSSDEENTDSDITIKEIKADELIQIEVNNKILHAHNGGERRDSIVDVDQWFIKHNNQSHGTDSRRDSNCSIGYDTRKVFPFGKSDPGAGSEFFESQSSVIETNEEKLANNNNNNNEHKASADETIEHSTLLKYLK